MLKLYKTRNFLIFIFLIVLFFFGGFFRFYNLNWDEYNTFHPDERNIDNAVTKIRFFSKLNPEFFAYGGFPIYLYRAGTDIVNIVTKQSVWTTDWGHINIIGRFFSALFSTLTLFPIYFLTKKLSGKKSAIIATVFYTFCVTSIQTAHYAVTESLITFIGVLLCYVSIKSVEKLNIKISMLLGIILGIGIASKVSASSFAIMPLLSFMLLLKNDLKQYKKIILGIVVFLVFSFIFILIFSPYTFFDFEKFMGSMRYESSVATGSLPVVYTFQFNGTLPYIFWVKNLFWQIGIVAFFCILGTFYMLFQLFKTRRKDLLIFLSFPLIYFLYIGLWHTKFIRYIVPIVPFFIIMASILLTYFSSKFKIIGNLLILICVSSTIVWALAFLSIYLNPQTRITASNWIYNNIPKDSNLLNEQWDDGLPVTLGKLNPSLYKIKSLDMYSDDNNSKIEYLASSLNQSDYIIFNSRRLYGTLIRLKEKYPITSNYYKLLFKGKLGYKKIAEFSSYPSFLGFNINDDSSEETFQVYDHPKVIVLENEKYYPIEELQKILKNEIIP